jgi:lipopolysaccharide export system protein LptC
VAAPQGLARLRVPLALIALIGLGWIVYQTIHAGDEIPPPPSQTQTRMLGGSANDKRIDGKSWSLNYDTATLSPDGSLATIERVHDGTIMRDGKPYMHMTAQHITANLALNDFVVTGPVTFTEVGGTHRRLVTDGAHYAGSTHVLTLDHPTTIRDANVTFHVASAAINFATGDTKLGKITGGM